MFKDRKEAGIKLVNILSKTVHAPCVIYAIPRGGVPVGFEIAMRMKCPLEIIAVKKIGAPGDEELALGAVTEGNPKELFLNEYIIRQFHIDKAQLDSIINRKHHEADELGNIYRQGRPMILNRDAVSIVVDDGIATGATVIAAVNLLKNRGQERIIIATPVVEESTAGRLRSMVDNLVSVDLPKEMYSVGEFYQNFPQVTDQEVIVAMDNSRYFMN
ncbi:MAG: hypothetical protein LVQ96_06550 [Thermoplasmatales archaeon]|nr:hypothetical protein [Thermoplasmatales archaeon]